MMPNSLNSFQAVWILLCEVLQCQQRQRGKLTQGRIFFQQWQHFMFEILMTAIILNNTNTSKFDTNSTKAYLLMRLPY
jgi:hypothetical protein